MLLQALAGALVASGVFYVMTPRMPSYQLNGIHLYDFSISPFLSLDCHLRAGIQVENANFFGAEIYSTLMDVYYTDWSGLLTPIGIVQETPDHAKTASSVWTIMYSQPPNKRSNHRQKSQSLHKNESFSNNTSSVGPFLTILPRTVTVSEANALSIFIKNLTPRVYLSLLFDVIKSGGSLDMLVSGVAHVQSALGLPLTLGIICDNSLSIRWRPFHITSRYCEVKSIMMGWKDLLENAEVLRHSTIESYSDGGRSGVFSKSQDLLNITHLSTSACGEDITTWHNF